MHLRRLILLAAALTALAAVSAQACPNHATRSATAALTTPHPDARNAALVAWRPRAWTPALPSPALAQGLRVAIDPVDHAFGMPAPDALSQQAVIADDAPVLIDRAPDGTLTAHLDDRFAQFSVATIGPGGKPTWTCVDGRKGAASYLKHPFVPAVPAAPKWEEK